MSYRYTIYTTVDITPTRIANNSNKKPVTEQERNQQRNFDTLFQVVSLRSNIYNPTVDQHQIDGVKELFPNPNLPSEYACWSFTFWCDLQDVFGHRHSALLSDLHMVPIVPALTETLPQFPPYFISYGDLKNIYIP
jgi:hypothetical protein